MARLRFAYHSLMFLGRSAQGGAAMSKSRRSKSYRRFTAIMPALALAMVAWPALADAIDGNWCHSKGGRFSIRGTEIVTPGGKTMAGDYSRHAFSYAVPAPEPERGAGQTVFMTLMNENTVHLRRGQASSMPETWVRCLPSISALRTPPPAWARPRNGYCTATVTGISPRSIIRNSLAAA